MAVSNPTVTGNLPIHPSVFDIKIGYFDLKVKKYKNTLWGESFARLKNQ